jgi:membrane protease YdiL (CAAX protease family)
MVVVALATILISVLVGMIFAWIWAIGRLWAGQMLLPENSPRAVPWGGKSVLAGFVTMISVSVGVSTAYAEMTGRSARTSQLDIMLVSALINSAFLVVMPLILRRTARAQLEDFGLEWSRLRRDAGAGFLAFLLIAPIVYGIQLIAVQIWERKEHPLELMMLEKLTGGVALLAIVSAVVLAPAVEELLFRGLLQGWLTRRLAGKPSGGAPPASNLEEWIAEGPSAERPEDQARSGLLPKFPDPYFAPGAEIGPVEERFTRITRSARMAAPILLTSAVFALVHMPQWPAPLAIFLLSLGLGLVYRRTGSLVAAFVLHAAFNGLSTLALLLVALSPAPLDEKVAPLPAEFSAGPVRALHAPIPHPGRR